MTKVVDAKERARLIREYRIVSKLAGAQYVRRAEQIRKSLGGHV